MALQQVKKPARLHLARFLNSEEWQLRVFDASDKVTAEFRLDAEGVADLLSNREARVTQTLEQTK